jgi:hypothetical protein
MLIPRSFNFSEYALSPKKRKAIGPHQAAPAPSRTIDAPMQKSASSSRRNTHSRHRSDISVQAIISETPPTLVRRTSDRQQTPTPQWHHHHHHPSEPPPRPPSQSRAIVEEPPLQGSPERAPLYGHRPSSQSQVPETSPPSAPALDARGPGSDDIEMS